ncbi:MAG: TlpA disulfide reductase family protein [Pirellulaceae bacterium]
MIRLLLLLALACLGLISGCSSKTEERTSKSSKYEAEDDSSDSASVAGGSTSPDTGTFGQGALPDVDVDTGEPAATPSVPMTRSRAGDPAAGPLVDGIATESDRPAGSLPPLADDADLETTLAYIGKANDAIRRLSSGEMALATEEAQVSEMTRVSREKLAAAEHAIAIEGISADSLSVAKRTKLEALSHLTGLRDPQAALQLKQYANELAESDDPVLVNESRVVRFGFALDKLRTGETETPDEVINLAKEFAASEGELDVPVFYSLRQGFGVLNQYGYDEAAREIRDIVAKRFAEHSVPQIAEVAKMMASASKFDPLDKLHAELLKGEEVAAEKWRTEIDALVGKPIDANTFQYLAGLVLSAEGQGQSKVAELAYAAIQEQIADAESTPEEIVTEAKAFLNARDSRSAIVGKPIELTYPDLAGAPIDWASYRGSVVVMPFWAATRPASLQILPAIQQLQQQFGEQIKVLGVNLDQSDEELAGFRQAYRLPFPSVRNPDPETRGIQDPLAKQLGIASFPFAVVVDAKGNVAKISMGPQEDLAETVAGLVEAK